VPIELIETESVFFLIEYNNFFLFFIRTRLHVSADERPSCHISDTYLTFKSPPYHVAHSNVPALEYISL